MPLWIEAWEWNEGNLDELASHGVARRNVLQVSQGDPRFRRNRRGRAASHQMIGPDDGGKIWVVCIVQAPDRPGVWRAVTGWQARASEREWYRRSR